MCLLRGTDWMFKCILGWFWNFQSALRLFSSYRKGTAYFYYKDQLMNALHFMDPVRQMLGYELTEDHDPFVTHRFQFNANLSSVSQETVLPSFNPTVRYRDYNILPFFLIPSFMGPVHALLFYLFKAHFNIILPLMLRSSKSSLSFRFPNQKSVYKHVLLHTCYMSHPTNSSRFDYPNNIWRSVQITKLLVK